MKRYSFYMLSRKESSFRVTAPALQWNYRYATELPQFFSEDVNGCPRLPLHPEEMASRTSFSVPIS